MPRTGSGCDKVDTKASGYLEYHCVDCDTSTAETIFIAYTGDMSCFNLLF
ncbi:hypothetical protein Hdeb2414_s0005g00168491 [Helianthus debilis subsp. tardiflorus]